MVWKWFVNSLETVRKLFVNGLSMEIVWKVLKNI